ncbi:hypothetical protein PIROE2DRAFT_11366 [Piromyces sp. E2]|nr:hypothetical protein PIROE2DRAFT_11366 [Piromyces sp. E2]|eukprot:OUM62363.1 hypothetical protein PIROE2DRAFT_11366 [Piromyces sp. E2]
MFNDYDNEKINEKKCTRYIIESDEDTEMEIKNKIKDPERIKRHDFQEKSLGFLPGPSLSMSTVSVDAIIGRA